MMVVLELAKVICLAAIAAGVWWIAAGLPPPWWWGKLKPRRYDENWDRLLEEIHEQKKREGK